MSNFTHLHSHSTFSFLDAIGTPDQIADRILELGHKSAAITDHGVVFGHIPYQKAFTKAGLKPIFGEEFYITDDLYSRTGTPSQSRGANSYPHVTVLAKSERGYRNLLKLSRLSWESGMYYKPRIDWNEIARYQEGLIVLSGCLGGYPSGFITRGQIEECGEFLTEQKKRIENFFIEIIPEPHLPTSTLATQWLLHFANELNLPIVMTADAHFPHPEDHSTEDLLLCVGLGKRLDDAERTLRLPEYQFYCSEEQLIQRAIDTCPEIDISWWNLAIANTQVIDKMCEVEIPRASKVIFPGIPKEFDSETYLFKWIFDGLENRYEKGQIGIDNWDIYCKRLHHEWEVIKRKGFCDYMLAILDVVEYMKSRQKIVVCRGSAGGSLMLWAGGASETDPILHELSFERFYDDNRPDPPDVDLDFEHACRGEAIDYVFGKYGPQNCSQIAALSRLKPRSALQDACFAYNIPRSEFGPASSFLEALEQSEDDETNWNSQHPIVQDLIKKYPQLKIIEKMIGQYRQSSIHAAGVLISNEPLENTIGVIVGENKQVIAAVDKYGAAELGFLKMDFLSVDMLDILKATLEKIGQTPEWLYSLPLNDEATLKTASAGLLAGIFQLDGSSAWTVGKQIGLDSCDDLIAASALCRPGPGGWVDTYKNHKNNPILFQNYLGSMHPIAANIVKKTYGILLYQEQVMRFAKEMAGFSWADVHKLRKGVAGSFGDEFMLHYAGMFVSGSIENGVSQQEASHWWNSIATHGAYSFNRSHCVTYGIISYWSLYLKTHYPAAFYCSFLALEGKASTPNEMLMKRLIREFLSMGGKLLPIDPVHSKQTFSMIDEWTMIGGYQNFKGIGEKTSEKILSKSPFSSWDEMYSSMSKSMSEKMRVFQEENPDPQSTIPLAPWYPIHNTPDFLKQWLVQNGVMNLYRIGQGIGLDKDSVIGGYVTYTQFSVDRIVFTLEDEFGSITARLPAKNVPRDGHLYRHLEIGDFIVITGWMYEGVMYCRGMKLVHRKTKENVTTTRIKKSKSVSGQVEEITES